MPAFAYLEGKIVKRSGRASQMEYVHDCKNEAQNQLPIRMGRFCDGDLLSKRKGALRQMFQLFSVADQDVSLIAAEDPFL